MKGIKETGTGKRLCCWLLTGIILTGQGGSPVFAEEVSATEEAATIEEVVVTEEAAAIEEAAITEETIEDSGLEEADIPQEENARAAGSDLPNNGMPGSIGGELLPVGSEFDEGGLHWEVTGGSTGNAIACKGPAAGTTVSGRLEIPLLVVHKDYVYWVPEISVGAFANCTELTELEIPKTYGSFRIGDQYSDSTGAFEGCINLRRVTIPNTCTMLGNNTFKGCTSLETFEAAPTQDSGIRRSFQDIRSSAFEGCTSLREVFLGDCRFLGWISSSTFKGCTSLEKVTLPENLQRIEESGFEGCSSLEAIILPSTLTQVGWKAFKDCAKLRRIKLPARTELVKGHAFEGCSSLVEAEMPDKIVVIGSGYTGEDVFSGCTKLKTLKITTTAPQEGASYATPLVKDDKSFDSLNTLPADRKVVFLNSDGTMALSGSDLMAAQTAYRAALDGDTTDDYWYGWEIGAAAMYPIEITVKKDNAAWTDSGKNFCLSVNGADFITYVPENTSVLEGTYRVYETTGSGRIDTQAEVTVDEAHTAGTAEVNYYTVTFYQDYEHKAPYGAETDQRPQIVLGGSGAVKPADPAAAEGQQFAYWMEEVTGSRELQRFDFANTMIEKTTDLYAFWSAVYHTIEVSIDGEGSISPRNNVNVKHGEDQSFVITPERDHHIKEILIDGTAIGDAELAKKDSYTYTFSDVREGHRIAVTFEENPEVTGPEGPGKPGTTVTPGDLSGSGTTSPEDPSTPGTTNPENPSAPGTTTNPENPSVPGTTTNPEDPSAPGTTSPEDPSAPGTMSGSEDLSVPGTSDSGNTPQASGVTAPSQDVTANPPAGSGNSTAGGPGASDQKREPKTGDETPVEMYATLAMIAGLTEVMLYFARNKKGMTEARKKELVSLLVDWAKGRGRLRRYAAIAAIFGLLLYYHSIGKRMSDEWGMLCKA